MKFKDGLINLNTRKFGTVMELIIQKLYGFSDSNTIAYDKYDKVLGRIEIKFSRALNRNSVEKISLDNLVLVCENFYNSPLVDSFSNDDFWCNIEQVKPLEFDVLYFGILFNDCIEIYSITSHDINNMKYFNDKQHRGNVGEGQFHIKRDNINYFRNNYLIDSFTWEELYDKLNK